MTIENDGSIVVQNAPATTELTTPEGQPTPSTELQGAVSAQPLEGQTAGEQQNPAPEKDYFDDYFENNPGIESFASNPSLYAPRPQYQQQPQYQQPMQQPATQPQVNPQSAAPAQPIDFNKDELKKYIENDDWAGYANAIAQKVQENTLSTLSPDKFKEIATQIASQQAKQVYQQQQAVRIVSDIRTGVINNLSKQGLSISREEQSMVENHAKSTAYDNYNQPIIDRSSGQPLTKIDVAYFDYVRDAQRTNKPVQDFTNFSIKYLAQAASKAFGKNKSQAPSNTQIRQTVNEIHAGGQPVTPHQESEADLDAKLTELSKDPVKWEAWKNSRRNLST
jgi:hypothetical protein